MGGAPVINDFGNDRIGKLLFRLSMPAILAQLINVLYSLVDRMYIGKMEGVGSLALAGMGLSMPIITLTAAFSALVGVGGSTRAAIAMGEGDNRRAEKIMGNSFCLLLIISVILTFVFLMFKRPLLYLFGASDDTILYAENYLTIYCMGTLFVELAMGMNNFINTQGFAKTGMLTVTIGAVLNIILDPIFIFIFDMGIAGAAGATILSQAVSAVWVMRFLLGQKGRIRLHFSDMALERKIVLPVLAIGLSPFIMQSTESLVQITLNSGLRNYGGDLYVSAMTVINSVMQLFLMPLMGLGQGAQPIISYNFGARKYDRVKKAARLLIQVSLIVSIAGWAAAMLFPQLFVRIFNNEAELIAVTVPAMRIFLAAIFAMGAQFACQQCMLAIGQAKVCIFLALLRKIILLIPLALVLPIYFGTTGIFTAEPISDMLAAITTIGVFIGQFNRILKKDEMLHQSKALSE